MSRKQKDLPSNTHYSSARRTLPLFAICSISKSLNRMTRPSFPRSWTSRSESLVNIVQDVLVLAVSAQYASASPGTTEVMDSYELRNSASATRGTMKGAALSALELVGLRLKTSLALAVAPEVALGCAVVVWLVAVLFVGLMVVVEAVMVFDRREGRSSR